MYKKIAVAISHNDRAAHLVSEACRMASNFNSELYLFHVYATASENKESVIRELYVDKASCRQDIYLYSAQGKVHIALQQLCKTHGVDILIFGASEKKGLMDYFKDSITLSLYKNSHTSLMILTHTNNSINCVDQVEVVAESKSQVIELSKYGLAYCQSEGINNLKINRIVDKGLATSLITLQEDKDELIDFEKRLLQEYVLKTQKVVENLGFDTNIELTYDAVFENEQSTRYPDSGNHRLLITKNMVKSTGVLTRLFIPTSTEMIKNPPCRLLIIQ